MDLEANVTVKKHFSTHVCFSEWVNKIGQGRRGSEGKGDRVSLLCGGKTVPAPAHLRLPPHFLDPASPPHGDTVAVAGSLPDRREASVAVIQGSCPAFSGWKCQACTALCVPPSSGHCARGLAAQWWVPPGLGAAAGGLRNGSALHMHGSEGALLISLQFATGGSEVVTGWLVTAKWPRKCVGSFLRFRGEAGGAPGAWALSAACRPAQGE